MNIVLGSMIEWFSAKNFSEFYATVIELHSVCELQIDMWKIISAYRRDIMKVQYTFLISLQYMFDIIDCIYQFQSNHVSPLLCKQIFFLQDERGRLSQIIFPFVPLVIMYETSCVYTYIQNILRIIDLKYY